MMNNQELNIVEKTRLKVAQRKTNIRRRILNLVKVTYDRKEETDAKLVDKIKKIIEEECSNDN